MTTINPQQISGRWLKGIALDLHTLSSEYIGDNEHGHAMFDTTYSEIGRLLHRLKYQNDTSVAEEIIAAAFAFLQPYRPKLDILIPVPPSATRPIQPVLLLAKGISASIALPLIDCISLTRSATPLKGVTDREKRMELLKGLYDVDPNITAGKHVLLFDDLYRSGATMNAITDLLIGTGNVASVRVLTITKTRVNR